MTAFRDSARIFRIADIIVDCDLLQLQQLACALGVRLPSVFRVDWSDS